MLSIFPFYLDYSNKFLSLKKFGTASRKHIFNLFYCFNFFEYLTNGDFCSGSLKGAEEFSKYIFRFRGTDSRRIMNWFCRVRLFFESTIVRDYLIRYSEILEMVLKSLYKMPKVPAFSSSPYEPVCPERGTKWGDRDELQPSSKFFLHSFLLIVCSNDRKKHKLVLHGFCGKRFVVPFECETNELPIWLKALSICAWKQNITFSIGFWRRWRLKRMFSLRRHTGSFWARRVLSLNYPWSIKIFNIWSRFCTVINFFSV